jgi:hypothetical protein
MKSEEKEIDKMAPGAVLNSLIQAEIFGAIPLTDEEWEIFRAAYMMTQGPQSTAMMPRPVKIARVEPRYETGRYEIGLMFYLDWPRDYSRDQFNSSRDLVDKMRADGWLFELYDKAELKGRILRAARFLKREDGETICEGAALAETDAHAICLAALKAVRALKAITK